MHRYATTVSALLLLLAATCAAAQKAVTLDKCEGDIDYPSFKNVTIDPCESDPCVIKRGDRYNVTFYVEATKDADDVQVTTTKQQESDTTHVNMMSSVSCFFMDVPCNVTKGEVFRGSVELKLSNFVVSPGELFYQLKVNSGREVFACGKTTLTVE
uniref:Putative ml domain protein n=1 Tax=Amblyomma aureolatum TaxID=187763 RepID=A0A1E1WXV1_9ACAR